MIPEKIINPLSKKDVLFNLLCDEYEVVKSNDSGESYLLNRSDVNEIIPLDKMAVCSLIINIAYKKLNDIVSQQTVNNIYSCIVAIATECKDYKHIGRIIYQISSECIYYDYGSDSSLIKVTKGKVCRIKRKTSKVLFLSKRSDLDNDKAYIPKLDVQPCKYLNIIGKLFNLDESQRLLFAVYIVTLFVPNINHPLLILEGEQGAAKSTTLKMTSKIIVPHDGDVNIIPNDIDDLATIIHNQYFTAFDNVSYISKAVSDFLCMTVTGSTYAKRKKYTDNHISICNIHKPVAINGLNLNIPFGDLIDRAIFVELKRIPDESRITEAEIWQKFYSYLPTLQGCAFSILSRALAMKDKVVIKNLPRLADFCLLGYCIAESIKNGYGQKFLKQYNDNINIARKNVVSNNPLLTSVNYFMDDKDEWTGSMTELLQELGRSYLNNSITGTLPQSFPKAANALSKKLKILNTDLSAIGITIEIGREANRFVKLNKNLINGNKNKN